MSDAILSHQSHRRRTGPLEALLAFGLLFGQAASAADGTWTAYLGGSWSAPGNWQSGVVADGVGSTAYLAADNDNYFIDLDRDVTIGHLATEFDRPILEGNRITLQTTSGTPTISVATEIGIRSVIAGTQGITVSGAGQLNLSGSNSYTGVTRLIEGMLIAGDDNALGASGAGNETRVEAGALLVLDGVTLNESLVISGSGTSGFGALALGANATAVGSITLDGDATISTSRGSASGDSTIRGAVSVPADTVLTLAPTGRKLELSGGISGAGVIRVAGSEITSLSTPNDFTGQTIVAGPLDIDWGSALQNSTVVMETAELRFADYLDEATFGGLSGNAGLNLSPFGLHLALSVGGNGEDTTYSGSLTGSNGSLQKTGNGTLILDGANSYGLGTSISAGTLVAGHDDALGSGSVYLSGGTLLVGSGVVLDNAISFGVQCGVLGGEGTIRTDLVVGEGDAVAPGASPGLLTVDGDYLQEAFGLLEIELGGLLRGDEYDVLNVTGLMALGGILDLTLIDGFIPHAGDVFDILDWGSLTGSFDTLSLPDLGPGLSWDTSNLYVTGEISAAGVPTPAPGTTFLIMLAGLPLLLRRKAGLSAGGADQSLL